MTVATEDKGNQRRVLGSSERGGWRGGYIEQIERELNETRMSAYSIIKGDVTNRKGEVHRVSVVDPDP